jgi:hypothetical protein
MLSFKDDIATFFVFRRDLILGGYGENVVKYA